MSTATGQRVWRILVVDDEENLNWSLVNSLRKDNYVVDGALTGVDALRNMTNQIYDIVISDVKMPGMDGFELLQWLRGHRPQTRVLMMTAFGSPTERAEAIRGGVIAYIEKPFDLLTFKEELRRMTSTTDGQRASGSSQTDGYDLLEVARVISLARRDIALLVEANGRSGRLRFLRGDLIWAECGGLLGDDAFVALTAPRSGRVQPEPWDGRSGRNVTQPLSALIYQAMTQRDRSGPTDPTAEPPHAPQATGAGAEGAWTRSSDGPTAGAEAAPASQEVSAGPSTAALAPLAPAQIGAARATLTELVTTLPEGGGAALLRPDGTVLAQGWSGVSEATSGTLSHLAACAQSALRAMLLGGWGDLEDLQITSHDRYVLVRRLGRSDRAALAMLVLPPNADIAACRDALREREPALLEALR
jgi:CheY-like chemotaxis protein